MKYMKTITNSSSMWVVLLLVLLLGALKFTHLQNNILSYDYFGLYLYLPATFIYNDPAISDLSWLQQVNAQYGNTPMFYQLEPHEGYNIIRFFSGMAILLSPFFFIGHAVANLSAYPADGFSMPYQLAMTFAAWFYVLLGLIFLRKVLLRFVNEYITSITLIALYLGTNLFFWTTFDAGAPHTILFALYSMLLWYTIRWHENQKASYAVSVGLLLGLIIVSRPSDIVVVAIPLLWNIYDRQSLIDKVKLVTRHYRQLLLLVTFVFLAGLPQIIYFKTYTGEFFFSPYTDPQSVLDWGNPRFAWVLFSFRKGWFIYAPLMVFSVIGMGLLVRRNKQIVLPLVVYFLLNLYLIASFTSLVSYGWRAFIQSYALLAIPLALVIAWVLNRNRFVKIAGTVILLSAIALTVFQSWQLMTGIIHGSRMTKAYYFSVLGKTSVSSEQLKLLRIDHNSDAPDYRLTDTTAYSRSELAYLDFRKPFENHIKYQYVIATDSTMLLYQLSKEMPYTPGVKVPYREITDKEHFWASMRFRVMSIDGADPGDLKLVATFTYRGKKQSLKGKTYKYRGLTIEPDGFVAGQWNTYRFDYLSPEPTSMKDQFETYLWTPSGKTFLVEYFQVSVYEPMK